ncbi:MAG: hypothetical protein ACLTT1_13440 [[Clostridium] scindens]
MHGTRDTRNALPSKAAPNPFLINILKEYGCGCDCSSYTELMLSEAIGVTGEDIVFCSR